MPARAADPGAESKTYVLVPGTWHGGWVWRDVRQLMRAAGHRVFTPTPTGVGERSHLISPDVGLDTHVEDIVNVIEWEELDDVILVGHSFGGMTITGVADRLRDRIRRVVFFDALVPHEARLSAVPRDPDTGRFPDWWYERAEGFIDGYKMDFFADYSLEMLVPADDERNRARLKRLLTPHPAKQWTDELVLENGGWQGLPRTYVRPTAQAYSPSSDRMPGPALTDPAWQFIELAVTRNGMMTHPVETARCFMALT